MKIRTLYSSVLLSACLSVFISCSATENKSIATDSIVTLAPNTFIGQLPVMLSENSALVFYDSLFWTCNDSGGENKIYGFNRQGSIVKQIEILNAENRDWEDIAQDENFIYIGDFGNNNGVRKDLKLYKIEKSDIKNSSSVEAKVIGFAFANQENFGFSSHSTPFDCEAVAELNGELFLFTKDWKNESTTVYNVPKAAGSYNLQPVDSFQINMLVTGADFSPDKTKLAISGYHDFKPIVHIFSDVSESNVFGNGHLTIALDDIAGAQTEGICFLGHDTLLVSCESTLQYPAQVFVINLSDIAKHGTY